MNEVELSDWKYLISGVDLNISEKINKLIDVFREARINKRFENAQLLFEEAIKKPKD